MHELLRRLPEPNNRVAIIGQTGCGKSELARQLLTHYDNEIIVDSKHDFSWGPYASRDPRRYRRIARSLDQLRAHLNDVARERSGDPVVYRAPWNELDSGAVDRVPGWACARRNCILYYDDFGTIAGPSDYVYSAKNFARAIQQGRSLGVGVWCSIQRPRLVPKIILTEAQIKYVFYLDAEEDRRYVQGFSPPIPWDELLGDGPDDDFRFVHIERRRVIGPHRIKVPAPVVGAAAPLKGHSLAWL